MPYTPINFLHAPKQDYPYGDLLKNAMEGYELARKPKQIAQEEQQREFANRLLQEQGTGAQHENYAKSLRNQYLPRELANKQAMSDMDVEFYKPTKETALERQKAALAHQLLKNRIVEKTGMRDAEADALAKEIRAQTEQKKLGWIDLMSQSEIEKNKALAEKARNPQLAYKPTTAQKNLAAAGLVPGSDEYTQALRSAAGLPSGRPTPPNTRPLEDMPVNERLDTVKRMRNVVNSYGKVKQVQNNIKEMRAIINENPKIAGSLASAFIDPHDPGIKHVLASWLTSEKDKTAIQKMIKLASDINLQELSSFGNNVSDARQKLIAETKANPNLTKETILYVLGKLEKQKEPYDAFVEATKEGLNGNYEVYDDPEAFRLENMSPEMLEWYKKKLSKKGGK